MMNFIEDEIDEFTEQKMRKEELEKSKSDIKSTNNQNKLILQRILDLDQEIVKKKLDIKKQEAFTFIPFNSNKFSIYLSPFL